MAEIIELSFAALLAADSEAILPADDAGVITALVSYGAKFSKYKTAPYAQARLNLLSGLMWLHAHSGDLAPAWARLSPAQRGVMAVALNLDLDEAAASPTPAAVLRRLLGSILPGATPQKRRPPDGRVEGQINRPGPDAEAPPLPEPRAKAPAASQPPEPPAKRPRKGERDGKRRAKDRIASSSSDDSSAASALGDDDLLVMEDAPPLGRMPEALGTGAAFRAQVAATCARSWLKAAVFETDVPVTQRHALWKARSWTTKDRTSYVRMIAAQRSEKNRSSRRENPTSVACPHRLAFAFSDDDGLDLDAKHLALVCPAERPADWIAGDIPRGDASRARTDYQRLLGELRTSWEPVVAAIRRNEQIGAPAISALFELLECFLARRYACFSTALSGPIREEVLANVARQFFELHEYFTSFSRDLADRTPRRPHHEHAEFAGSRYLRLFSPVFTGLLDTDYARQSGGALAFAAGYGQSTAGGAGGGRWSGRRLWRWQFHLAPGGKALDLEVR